MACFKLKPTSVLNEEVKDISVPEKKQNIKHVIQSCGHVVLHQSVNKGIHALVSNRFILTNQN